MTEASWDDQPCPTSITTTRLLCCHLPSIRIVEIQGFKMGFSPCCITVTRHRENSKLILTLKGKQIPSLDEQRQKEKTRFDNLRQWRLKIKVSPDVKIANFETHGESIQG